MKCSFSDPAELLFTTSESKASTLDKFENNAHMLFAGLILPPFNPGPNAILKMYLRQELLKHFNYKRI